MMSSKPVNKLNTDRLQSESFVKQAYESYKTFISDGSLPAITIEVLSEADGTDLARHNFVDGKHIVSVHKDLHHIQKVATPYLYHEFTHLLDHETNFVGTDVNTRAAYLFLFTEFHASQIMMMSFLGFESINDMKHISLSNEISDLTQKLSLSDFLTYKKAEYLNDLGKLKMYGNMKNFLKGCAVFMYYLGWLSVCTKFSKDDFREHSNVDGFYPILGDTMYKIIEKLNRLEPITNDKLIDLASCQLLLGRKFGVL